MFLPDSFHDDVAVAEDRTNIDCLGRGGAEVLVKLILGSIAAIIPAEETGVFVGAVPFAMSRRGMVVSDAPEIAEVGRNQLQHNAAPLPPDAIPNVPLHVFPHVSRPERFSSDCGRGCPILSRGTCSRCPAYEIV